VGIGEIFEGVSRRTGCAHGRKDTVEDIVELAVEIAREGREGRKIGTLFVIGSVEELLQHSRPLILDPLYGHPPEVLQVTRADFRETVKELAQLDGAFLVADDGTFVSAGRFVEVDLGAPENFLPGLGTRHAAGASISRSTDAVAVVVSQSSVVRVFAQGTLRDHPGAVPDVEAVARRPESPHRAPPRGRPDAGRGRRHRLARRRAERTPGLPCR
jgi:DNA integrity scanning protein DisA with diadenylate cyclase activity